MIDPKDYYAGVSEAQFRRGLCRLAEAYKWQWRHFTETTKRVRRGDKYVTIGDHDARGIPDLLLFHAERGIHMVWEVKTNKGKLTDYEAEMLYLYDRCGIEARVARPRDWDELRNILRGVLVMDEDA